jgi:hypothetical protein
MARGVADPDRDRSSGLDEERPRPASPIKGNDPQIPRCMVRADRR